MPRGLTGSLTSREPARPGAVPCAPMGAAPLSVRLLGPVEVVLDGEMSAPSARMHRNLLVALALQPGRVVGVDSLVHALWADTPPDSALGTLQSYVSTLRRDLGDRDRDQPVLDRRGEGYVLVIPPDAVDTVRFEQQVAAARDVAPAEAEARLADALALWRGPALGEVASEPFARPSAARLDELRLAAEEARIDAGLALGRHQALVPEVEALVAAHPLREGLTAQLMVALYRSGRQADALRAFERTRAALVDELGLSPSADLVALEGAVLRQEVDALVSPVGPTTVAPPGAVPPGLAHPGLPAAVTAARRADSPFVGRAAEVDRLVAAWEDRARGRRVLAVNGDAGIGKTRLVAEVAARAAATGGTVLWGTGTADGGSAYRPFVEALRPLVAGLDPGTVMTGPGAVALARLLPELPVPGATAAATPAGAGGDRGPLFDTVTDLLARATGGRPTLLVLDDLQWADAASCALLVHLARAPELAHVRIAVTYRTEEATRPHPSAASLAELRRLRLVEQLPLSGLDDEATAELVSALAGPRVGEVEDDLHERSEGNPFFVEELVAHALSGGDRLPVAVVDLVERRLAGLDPEHRRALAAAAVLGRSFGIDLLALVVDRPAAALLDVFDAAVEANLLVEDAPPVGRFAFAHALIRDGLLEGMTALRRAHTHLAAADAIEALAAASSGTAVEGDEERVSELAHHLVQAGAAADPERTVAALHRAARRALAVAAYDAAEEACGLALERVDLAAATPAATDLLLTLAEARTAVGDAGGARQVYRWAADAARAGGDGARLGLAATGLGAGSGVGVPMNLMAVDHERVAWLEEALALLPSDDETGVGAPVRALRTRFLAHLAVATYDGDLDRCDVVSQEAVAAAEGVADPTYRSAALIARRMALWTPDAAMDERVDVGARSIVEADAGGDLLYRIVARLAHLNDLLEAALLDRFDAVLAEADDLCRPLHQARWDWMCDMSGVPGLVLRGRYDEADEVIAAARRAVGDAQGTMPRHVETSSRLVIDRDRGQLPDTVERLARVEALAPRPIFDAAAGFTRALTGDRDRARAHLAPHAAVGLTDVPRDHHWTMTIAWYAETAHVVGDVGAAAAAADLLAGREGRMLCLGGLVAAGLVGRVRGVALATAGDLDAAVAVLDGALAGHRALGLRPWVAHTALDLARALRWRAGPDDAARANALTAEGEGLAAALGLAIGPEPVRPT